MSPTGAPVRRAPMLLHASRHPLAARVAAGLAASGTEPAANASLVLGVSGGSDSLAMMILVAAIRARTDRSLDSIVVVSIDHGLRPENRGEAERACALAEAIGIRRARIVRVEVGGGNVLAAARVARRRAFESVLSESGSSALLLAHQAEDRAEGLLLALSRGAGLDAAANLVARRDFIAESGRAYAVCRPLLECRREELRAFLVGAGVEWSEDPSNQLRARGSLRGTPGLSRLVSDLAVSAGEYLAEAVELLDHRDAMAREALEATGDSIGRDALDQLPVAVQREVLRRIHAGSGSAAGRANLDTMLALLRSRDRTPHRFPCSEEFELVIDRNGARLSPPRRSQG